MDADIGVQVLGFSYMKGCPAHAGFPEIGYGGFCERLVKAGYKVARVEQTETPDMMKVRKQRGAKGVKVVNREVCSIVSAGTRTFCYMDDIRGLEGVEGVEGGVGGKGGGGLASWGPLLSIKEVLVVPVDGGGGENEEGEVQPVCEYGIAIIDAARGIVTLGMCLFRICIQLYNHNHQCYVFHIPSNICQIQLLLASFYTPRQANLPMTSYEAA